MPNADLTQFSFTFQGTVGSDTAWYRRFGFIQEDIDSGLMGEKRAWRRTAQRDDGSDLVAFQVVFIEVPGAVARGITPRPGLTTG